MPLMRFTPDLRLGWAERGCRWGSRFALFLSLPASLFLFDGCSAGAIDPSARSDGSKATRIIELYQYQGGPLVDEWTRRYFSAELDSLRTQGISDSAIRDVEDVIRRYLATVAETAIAPVFTSAYSSQQMEEVLYFLESPAGREFVEEQEPGLLYTAIVENMSPENRDAAGQFINSPTGMMFLRSYNQLAQDANMQAQNLIMRRQSDLDREITRVIERDVRTQINTGQTPAFMQ